ncbi:MAG: Gfo/Idh/MocA family oxidoreductase [Planctomycetota bacterium]|jgi:myo-inositol 2-dehydrogenase/D-chiro-inositol 1-dehydrogenase/scyllo-inositol 2-dehydrogenase (NAD+)|nr:Gfo/Idh/MocA family oxidoreductase [Planctomycetota bacterium]
MLNGELGICVVGSGRAGMIHAVNFAKNVPGARLVALADPVRETAQAAARQLGIDTCFSSHREALDDPRVDALVVVTPTKFHRDIVVEAAGAGRHILCEKPMAMTEAECDVMIEATTRNQVVLQIGFMRRFDAGFMRAKAIVDSGEIGEVVMVRSNTRGPSIPQPWMYDISKSNGPLAEVNSHDIDAMRWFSGGEFTSIYAIGGNYRCPDARTDFPEFYDNVVATAAFDNGVQGMLDGAQGVGYAYDARMEILGVKGCVFIGRLRDDAVLTCTAGNHSGVEPLVESWRGLFSEAYLNEDRAFVECVRTRGKPRVGGHDGKMAVKVVAAGNRSIRDKRIVGLAEVL